MKNQYLLIGEVVKPQGIRGEVKLKAESQDEKRYARLQQVYIKKGSDYLPCRVLRGRASGGFAYLQLEGIEDRNQAESLRGTLVYVDREHAIQPADGEFFICDLEGCRAVTETGEMVGVLREVLKPNRIRDVYVFDTPRGEMMMPALKEAILHVDVEKGEIILKSSVLSEICVYEDEPAERDE